MRATRFGLVVLVLVAAAVAEAGHLMVTCRPGYRVYLDGEFTGLTTVDQDGLLIADVAAGNHAVRIEKQGFVPFESSVDVPDRGFAEIRVPRLERAMGAIEIVCDSGHRVYLDGRLVGLSTADGLTLDELEPGAVTLRVEKLDRESFEQVVEVVGGETVEVVVDALEATGTEPAADAAGDASAGAVAGSAAASNATVSEGPAPEVLDQDAASIDQTAMAAATIPSAEGFDLERGVPTPSDVLFAYRARGGSLTRGGKVTVHRERGGPRAPVMVFWCVDQPECQNQTKPNFAPGSYRFRINCRLDGGTGSVDADAFVDVDAASGHSYLVDVVFDGGCRAQMVDLSLGTDSIS